MRWALVALWVVCACGGAPRVTPAPEQPGAPRRVAVDDAAAPAVSAHFVIRGAEVLGYGRMDIEVEGGRIAAIGAVDASLTAIDMSGKFIAPGFIDSHVHLAYFAAGKELLDRGVIAVVDLAAPLAWLDAPDVPPQLRVIASGPMVTARRGYPTQSWGSDGYGIEVGGAREAEAAVDELVAHGAKIVKLPITDSPVLNDETLRAAVTRAHGHGLKVVSHALSAEEVRTAAAVGVDALAHTPATPLREAAAWRGRAVISTLAAFGGGSSTVENLRTLRAAGAVVLYGTDLGNTQDAGISREEIVLMRAAGMDGAAILAAGTQAPAQYWGLLDAEGRGPGVIIVGGSADFLVLAEDPRAKPETLATPEAVYVAGVRRMPGG